MRNHARCARVFGRLSMAIVTTFFLLTARAAFANPTYVVTNGKLVKIEGIDVGGVLYDVEFKDGTFGGVFGGSAGLDFITAAAATAAVNVLNGALVDGPAGNFDSVPNLTFGCETLNDCGMITPYGFDQLNRVQAVLLINTNAADTISNPAYLQTFSTTPALNFVWADWTIAATTQPRAIVEYRFEEGTGLTVTSSGSRTGMIGSLQEGSSSGNGPIFATDTPAGIGSAFSLRFDGTNDMVRIPDTFNYTTDGAPGSPAASQLTVEAWIKPTGLGGQKAIWDDYGSPGVFFALSGSAVQLSVSTAANPGQGVSNFSGKITTGVWQHVAGVYDGTQLRIYVDGMDTCVYTQTSGAIVDNSSVNPSSAPIAIGADGVTIPALNYTGLIDDVRIYATALKRDQLAGGFFANRPAPSCGTSYSINDRGVSSRRTEGNSADVAVGYGRIHSNAGNAEPAGVAIFGLKQRGVLTTEAGVPASRPLLSGRIPVFIGDRINTGLALANPFSQDVTIDFYFTDENGATFRQDRTIIPAYSQLARFLTESPFNGGESVAGSFTFIASSPVGAIALRSFRNAREDFLITTLPVVDMTSPSVGGITVLPHYASGGEWTTEILLVNPSDSLVTGTLQFFDSGTPTTNAQPVAMTLNNVTNTIFPYDIPPRAARRYKTSGGTGLQVGSVAIAPTPSNPSPTAVVVFSLSRDSDTVSEAGVLGGRVSTAFRMYVEAALDFNAGQVNAIQTGFAISNPALTPISVRFDLFTDNGVATGHTSTIDLQGRGHTAMFLNQIPGFQTLPQSFRGLLRISTAAQTGVVITGLRGRYNESGDFLITTTPAADETAPFASGELLFPHYVDGGGFTTQFIIFGSVPGAPAVGRGRFFLQTGAPTDLILR